MLPYLLLGPSALSTLGVELQVAIKALRAKLVTSIESAWVDREVMMEGVGEGAGGGLVEVIRPTVKEWTGLGFFD